MDNTGNSSTFFENRACRYYPCHTGLSEINCLFCYCPLYGLRDCPGTYTYVKTRSGARVKSCMHCDFPHRRENCGAVIRCLTGRDESGLPGLSGLQDTPEEAELRRKIQARWDGLAMPIDSLGKMEKLITQIGVIQGKEDVKLTSRALLIFAGDHGVVREGVTQTGSSVTKTVAENLAAGKGVTSILARKAGADLFVIDAGMDTPRYPCKELVTGRIVDRKVRRGTGDIAKEDAMSREECLAALAAGEALAGELKERGYDILATGEMGIGNTTPSAVLTGHFLGRKAEAVAGRGAGLGDAGLERKIQAIARSLSRIRELTGPVSVLAAAGGLEIAMMTGLYLGAARSRIPVLMDGVISQAAALTAVKICPDVRGILIPTHRSKETCGDCILAALGMDPPLHADLSLGEGSGAVMLLPMLDMALAVYEQMSRFADIGIAPYERLEETT